MLVPGWNWFDGLVRFAFYLRLCYEMPGTKFACAATRLCSLPYSRSYSTLVPVLLSPYPPTHRLCEARY
eukprot:2845502-Rhodomonas_salina.1